MNALRAALAWLRADRATLPRATPATERTALAVLALASVWFAAAATWEIGAPFGAGHYAAATAVATGGENVWRWGVLGAVTHYTAGPPQNTDFYCHHPWGIFWTAALFVKVFGHHDWVCRLPAVLMSASMPPLLYASGRALWGPAAGAASALGFTVVPIALSFANFFALEVPVMFGVAVCIWGTVRLGQSGRRRWLVVALSGLASALHADWSAFVFAAFLLAGLFARLFLLRRYFPPPLRWHGTFWAAAACLAVASAAFYVIAFASLDQLEQLLRQGAFRSAGMRTPLGEVLEARKTWIETSFTPLAIALGKLALPICALRLLLLRRDGEWLPLCVLGMAVVQYVVFKQGADVHFFWPHYFALYFALALGALVQTLDSGLARLMLALRRPKLGPAAPAVSLVAACLVSAAMLPDAVRALVFARKTGGRFNEKGSLIHPDIDKVAAFELIASRLQGGHGLSIHAGMKPSYWMSWTLQRPLQTRPPWASAVVADQYFMLDARFTSAEELAWVFDATSPEIIGPFWFVDRGKPPGPALGFRIERREPNALERYLVSGSHALRQVVPDPWVAWEVADHFGGPTPAPAAEPAGLEALRAAHNQAVAAGDGERARALLRRLLRGTDQTPRCRYADGSELLGVRFERGASDVLTVYLRAGGPQGESRFGVESIVEAAPAWSLVGADRLLRDVGMPPSIPPARWKADYVYSSITEVMKRPGRERFVGGFRGPEAPRPVDCSPAQTLLVLADRP